MKGWAKAAGYSGTKHVSEFAPPPRTATGANPVLGEREAEIEARVNAASPGPWQVERVSDTEAYVGMVPHRNGYWLVDSTVMSVEDAEFIAHAVEDVPYLLARVATQKELLLMQEELLRTLTEALRLISVSDGANTPAGVPTSEYLRSLARAALSGVPDADPKGTE